MDILKNYLKDKKKTKINISKFFGQKSKDIENHNITLDLENFDWKCLEKYWKGIIEDFLKKNPKIEIKSDFYKVDFSALLNKAKIETSKINLTSRIVEGSIRYVIDLIPAETKNVPTLNDENLQKKFAERVAALKKDNKNKDILSLGIIDFVSKNKSNGTKMCLGKDIEYFTNIYAFKLKKSKRMGDLFSAFIDIDPDLCLKKNIEEAKKKIKGISDDEEEKKKDAKDILQIVKIYKKRDKKNQLITGEYNENEYLFFIIEPMFGIILKRIKEMKLKCGEPYLKIAAEEDNDKLFDEDFRSKGPKIDLIFKNTCLNLDISILEISGANNKTNRVHFLEDRLKIAKNLKVIINGILSSSPFASPIFKRKLKVYGLQIYGLQIYLNKLFIYSLHKPDDLNFVYVKEKEVHIPTNNKKMNIEFSKFISEIYILKHIIQETNENIKELFSDSSKNMMFSSSSSGDSSSEDENRSSKRQKIRR